MQPSALRSSLLLGICFVYGDGQIVAYLRDFVGGEETDGRFAYHDGLEDAALLALLGRAQGRRIGCRLGQRDRAVLGVGIGDGLSHDFRQEVVARVVEGERRRMRRDPIEEQLAVVVELGKAQVRCLEVDLIFLEGFEDLVIPLPVAVKLADVFLVDLVPCGENLLLLAERVPLLCRHGRICLLRVRPEEEDDGGGEGEHETEERKDASWQVAVKEHEQEKGNDAADVNKHDESFQNIEEGI